MAISEEASHDYQKTSWAPGMPITQERMTNIEDNVYINREAIQALDTITDSNTSIIGNRPASGYNDQTIWQAIDTKLNQTAVDQRIAQQLSGVTQDTSLGRDAMTQIANATTAALPTAYANLDTRFTADEELIKKLRQALGQVYDSETGTYKDIYTNENTISTVLSTLGGLVNSINEQVFSSSSIGKDPATGQANSNMSQHMSQIDSQLVTISSALNTILASTGVDENNNQISMSTRIQQLIELKDEVDAAHRAVEEGEQPDTLAQRFAAIESQLNTITGNVNDNYVKKSDVRNDFTHSDTNLPLSALKGKELRDMIGGEYTASSTVAGAISTAQSTAETNAQSYADTNKVDKTSIYNDLNKEDAGFLLDARQGKALKDLIDDLDTDYQAADRAIDTRLVSVEDELEDARIQIGTDENTQEPIMSTLDQRLDAMDTTTAGIRSDLTTVIAELGMNDTNGLKTIGTRVDDLADNIASLATELDMQMSEGKITDTQSRIDDLAYDISHTATQEDNTVGLTQRITTLETNLDTAENNIEDLDQRLDMIDGGETLTGNTLVSRMSAAEGAITNLQNEPKSATEIVASLPQTGDPNKDYLLGPNEDGKYFYYKWIIDGAENNWKLISGGGSGEGNTSGFDLSADEYDVLEEHEENTDYYVTRADGVHHYRYVPVEDTESGELILTEIEIGQFVDLNKIKRYNIATTTGTVEGEEVTYLNLYQYDYNENNNAIDTERQPFTRIVLPKGGSGSTSTSINKLTRIGDQTIQKIVNSKVMLRVFYSSWDSDGAESSAGTYTLTTGNTVVSSGTLNSGAQNVDLSQGWQDNTAGFYEFDVTDYCNVGNTVFNLSVTVNGVNLGKDWTVNIIDLHLESDAPDVLLINATESYNFPYTAFGALTKTLYIVIDDDTDHKITQTLSSVTSGRAAYAAIPVQEHGAHKIEMYLTAVIGGVEQTTPSIIREYIWYDANNTEEPLILASPKNGQTITAQQYSTIEIPYQVYKKDASTIQVDYYVDNVAFDSVTLEDTNIGMLSYLAATQGAHTLKIMVDNDAETALIINLNITELDINVSPVAGAIIDFDPTMLTNSSTNRLPSWTVGSNTYSLTASDNFNWSEDISGGGYKTDADGKAFVIKAGSYVDLNYPMFARNGSNNILTNGAEMKIIFKVSAVRDVNAIWYQNTGTLTEKTVGIQLGAHSGWLKTDKATDTSTATTNSEYPKWVSGTTYAIDDITIYKDTIYKCIKVCEDHTGVVPGTTAGDTYWKVLTGDDIPSDTSEIEAWAADAEYAKDDIVSYNTAYYKCKKVVINEITTDPKTASDNWLSMGKIETEVLATNSYLYMPYSEEDKIELDININKYNADVDTNFIMSYEDGVPSKAYAYEYGAAGDGLYHDNTIRIGSNDCDIYIYHLRIYNKALTTADILQNFIADGNGISEKVERYNRNCIYWDSTQEKYFTSPSATAILDPIKLAEVMPDVKVLMLDTPVFTVGKKNFVQGSSLRCIHTEGGNIYKSRGDADNWLFTNGFHSGQGTTSDNYGQSSRNVDFLFEVDGVNYPTKKKNMGTYVPSSDYVSKVYIGKDASTWNGTSWEPAREAEDIEICDNWKGDKCKVSLTETSVPNNYFNLKVNVASSENVNNALFQKRYDDFLVYNAPAQTAQIAKHRTAYAALGLTPNKIKVKNSMEFVPAVLFVRENEPDITKHTEFADTNWHFYALGNIGDSKKTDYTRAYDPDDMNEFTCENSDNNTNNGQFQSGVFMYQNVRAIETPYEAFDSEKTYNENDIVVNNGNIQIYNGSSWSNATLTGWTDSETPYFAPYTAPNTMQYLFPITSSEWNVQVNGEYVNYKHNTLVNEEFDGDHSFEFRYACRGDYRDGDLINETDGQDDNAQFDLNHDVMLALYEWIITATEEQYAAEAPQWFVKSAMEFFYAYTHYYTMMDNRAKNTFWHFAKTGTYIEASRPVKALLHVYEESTDNGQTWVKATGTEIDPNKKYRTQYAFDLWAYDMDTALGIDNNGALVFPYGKEDGDYRTEGDPSSGYAFNGAGSIFWRRLKKTFSSELVDIMTQAKDCFKSEDLINEFDTYQNCYPEEIWRLDIERKYIRTFTGNSVDNSVTTGKQNPRFLTSMMQGRKKYQRRQWIRNQGVYFNSKYRLADITDNSNTIEFNCTTPADIENIAVTPSYRLQLTPYQDMYLNVQVGNGNYKDTYITVDESKNLRAKANQVYTFDLSGNYQETRIYINGANHLSAIGNLAPMYPYSFDLRALAHIKTLNIGTEVSEYTNTKFTELKLPTFMPLLESLNIKNCHSVAGTIALATANNIRTVEATGTAISGISLPDYTSIQTLHIPSTVTALNLYGARFLTDFKVYNSAGVNDYSTLYKLHIYDSDYSSSVDWMDIASAILSKKSLQTELSLLKLYNATIEDIQELDSFNEFKPTLEANGGILEFGGIIHVTGDWSEIERDNYMIVWPQLTFDVSAGTKQNKWKVTYEHDDGTILKTLYVDEGSPAPDIYSTGELSEVPTKPQTERESYRFGNVNEVSGKYIQYSGWHLSTSNQPISTTGTPYVFSNMRIITYFVPIPRTYQIRWYLDKNPDNRLVKTSPGLVSYGGGYDQEAPTVQDIHTAGFETCSVVFNGANVSYKIFNGWEKLPTNINPTANDTYYAIHANWIEVNNASINSMFTNTATLTPEQLLVLSAMDAQTKDAYNIDSKIDTSGANRLVCTMGSDNNVEGTELISTPFRLDQDDAPYTTSIQPLKTGNDAFTLVIDYCFNEEMTESITTNYSTLVSCYYSNTSAGVKNGFSLFYGKSGNTISGPRVGFGDIYNSVNQSVLVGSDAALNMRNIVVLRHPANESTLYVYSGLSGSSLPSEVVIDTINWQNYNSNAYLNIGQLGNDADSTDGATRQVSNGKGTIYWMKYWSEDLGQGECKKLASWPHEQITYGISYLSDNATSTTRAISNTATSSIHLASLNTLSHGTYYQGRTQESGLGWGSSTLENIMNKRIMNGLPITLQSILCKDSTSYTIGERQDGGQGQISYGLSSSGGIVRDYIRPYSLAHVIPNEAVYKNAEESAETAPFPWLDSDNIIVYDYGSNGWTLNTSNDSGLINYLNIRFPNKAITWGAGSNRMRVFREINSGTIVPSSTTVANTIYQATNTLKSGDIYIMKRGEVEYTFIYATTQEILALGLQPTSTSFDSRLGAPTLTDARGLWIRAEQYWTRSVIVYNGFNFGYIYEQGTPNTNVTNQVDSRGLKFSQILTI